MNDDSFRPTDPDHEERSAGDARAARWSNPRWWLPIAFGASIGFAGYVAKRSVEGFDHVERSMRELQTDQAVLKERVNEHDRKLEKLGR